MEEIITVDGKQFKLSTDRPLTAIEKAQTIAQIRKQTGCSSCSQPRSLSSFGGIQSLQGTCPAGKTGGDTLTMVATAISGVAPYNAKFYKDVTGTVAVPNRVQIGVLSTPAGLAIAVDGATATDTYVLTDLDISSANFDGTLGAIQLISTVTDSCPTGGLTCEQVCTMTVACPAPTCSFVVT